MNKKSITQIKGKELERFLLDVENNVGVITFNHVPHNIIDAQFEQELIDICDYINTDDDIWVCVVIANGANFSVGVDIKLFAKSVEERTVSDTQDKYYDSALALYELRVPVICAIHGFCLGGGLCYMAGADIAMAAEGSRIGIPEASISVTGGSGHLARILPVHIMRDMAYTGKNITAEEMNEYGVFNAIVPKEELRETAMNKALELTKQGPHILRYFKACMDRQEDFQMKRKNDLEVLHTRYMAQHDDFHEALKAFLEKRKPEFTGK